MELNSGFRLCVVFLIKKKKNTTNHHHNTNIQKLNSPHIKTPPDNQYKKLNIL